MRLFSYDHFRIDIIFFIYLFYDLPYGEPYSNFGFVPNYTLLALYTDLLTYSLFKINCVRHKVKKIINIT